MSGRPRLLVTGASGDFGQAVIKALRLSASPYEIHGCDAGPQNIGTVFTDVFHAVPAAADPRYVESLDTICRRFGIQAVIPASEAEITVLSRLASPLSSGSAVVCLPAAWIDAYGDKLSCQRLLQGKVDIAPFADGEDAAAVKALSEKEGFPLVVKPRVSYGSRSLRVAHDARELEKYLSEVPRPIVQKYLDDEGGEYSVGVYASDGYRGAIAFRRELGPMGAGCTWYAETSDDPAVLDYAMRVLDASRLEGSANVQVRKTSRGVRLLEINARFSSLAAARAFSGFNDVEWSVRKALGLKAEYPRGPFKKIRFRRFFHELVDQGQGFAGVEPWTPKRRAL